MVVIYIGDELTAAGFRLAGAQILLPAAGEEAASLAQARGDGQLVLVSADVAARIPRELLGAALAALAPLTLVVPDLLGRQPLPDRAQRLRRQMGME
ncbi:V-type ATP synthase subunit F [Noviherbaspirillum sedimenti]|uniref:Vacuolar H+transporting two-sector ATPase F subunit n=1 Tax=Noviherbaspirillum sedimenti TaxID=2320865 RepID=A0A3A3FW58_9BURK|nr:V-type ATP synthase subunit F [Noviherbaspirillum sedimenti]RJG00387.1 Vacuolar H+transporting two-sector ATPase F subunit [Noviherbaspirillum sedimenti]